MKVRGSQYLRRLPYQRQIWYLVCGNVTIVVFFIYIFFRGYFFGYLCLFVFLLWLVECFVYFLASFVCFRYWWILCICLCSCYLFEMFFFVFKFVFLLFEENFIRIFVYLVISQDIGVTYNMCVFPWIPCTVFVYALVCVCDLHALTCVYVMHECTCIWFTDTSECMWFAHIRILDILFVSMCACVISIYLPTNPLL